MNLTESIERMLLKTTVPPSVVVNEEGEVVYIHGRTGQYLEPAEGRATLNLRHMAREGLQYELGRALKKAVEQDHEVRSKNLRVKTNGAYSYVDLVVKRLPDGDQVKGLLLVTFFPSPAPDTQDGDLRQDGAATDPSMAQELEYTRHHLQRTIEELEAANEELKSTNEELQSMNEELQSTNEELETAKEEAQSLNEELQTVNSELQAKLEELSKAGDDMNNLLNSIDIGVVFLDPRLHIKRFTNQATHVIKLIPSDIGRPIGDIVSRTVDVDLGALAHQVLHTLEPRELEVRTDDDTWYLVKVRLYRTVDSTIGGVVIALTDISRLKRGLGESGAS